MHANGVLVLNRSWVAIHVCSVERAISLLVQDLAMVVTEDYRTHSFLTWRDLSAAIAEDGNRFIHAPNFRLAIPEVILLTRYNRIPPLTVKFNRRNIYLRDNFQCQYCGVRPPREELTIDHVLPRSGGGPSEWENVVVACPDCNAEKGSRLVGETGMAMLRRPRRPHWMSIIGHAVKGQQRPAWEKFVDRAYWNAELMED